MFTPGWKNKNIEKALKWVERQPENSRALSKAAERSANHEVRQAAVARITDQATLLRLVKAYCHEAVSSLSDTEALYALAASPVFWGGPEQDVSYSDLLMKDPPFSKVMKAWTVSLDVPKGNERLKAIRLREKQYGFAELAFQELRKKGSDEQIENLFCSRYVFIRARAMSEALHRHPDRAESYAYDDTLDPDQRVMAIKEALRIYPERAGSYADDEKLCRDERIEAMKKVTDHEQRKRYCERFNTHEWEVVSSEAGENGDHWDEYTVLRCIYCGKEETRSSRRRL